jgi:hypothetical protein
MEMELFRAQGATEIDQLPAKVNAWLRKLTSDVEVKHVSSALTASQPAGNSALLPVLVITVWWGKK